jgi:hypothetical protein
MNHLNNILYQWLIQGLVLKYIVSYDHFDQGITHLVFSALKKSVHHLFFGYVVAQRAWRVISQILGVETGTDYESVAKMWLCNKKYGVINIVTSAVCWSIWMLRNAIIFQEVAWVGMKLLWEIIVPMLRCWRVLVPLVMEPGYKSVNSQLEKVLMMPEMIESMTLRRDWECMPNSHLKMIMRRHKKTAVVKQWRCSSFHFIFYAFSENQSDVISELSGA